jgi:hypothetical protein
MGGSSAPCVLGESVCARCRTSIRGTFAICTGGLPEPLLMGGTPFTIERLVSTDGLLKPQ